MPANLISGIMMIIISILTSALTTKLKRHEATKAESEKERMRANLLSITRIDSGMVKIIKTSTVLKELIDSVILKFRKRYPNQDVTLEIPDDMIVIPMDPILIEQVIVNITHPDRI